MSRNLSIPFVVLIVEDEALIRMTTADILTDEGFQVVEAGDADEAMHLLEVRPDVSVLLTDVRMPGTLDGIRLARVAAKRWPHLGIVVTSGHALPGRADLPEQAVFLPKPYRPSGLLREVEAVAMRVREGSDTAIRPGETVATRRLAADQLLRPDDSAGVVKIDEDGWKPLTTRSGR